MGATYTRQSSYTDGDVITAAHTNDEFDQLLAAFQASSGHTHDGTANEGGPITKLLGNTLTFGAGTAGTDITITFDGETSDGVLKWMEDEDYFEFSDDILVASTEKLQFRDTAIYINSSTDGQLDLVADTEIQLAATTVDLNGNLDVSGSLTLGGVTLTSTATELNLLDGVSGLVQADFTKLAAVDSTATELNIVDGDTSIGTTAVSDGHGIVMNHGGTMAQTTVQTLAAYLDDEITAMPNLVTTAATTVGALNSGSITSGFGSIDNGSSAITTTGTITYGSLSDGSITITAFVDEDNMASNSATLVPTQQSVKAYVDTQLTAEDLDVTTDSGTIDIDLDSETLTIAGGEGIDTSATGTTVTIAGEDASTSNKGVASFSDTFFSVSSGAVSLDAAQTGITSVVNSSLEIGRDADNRIKFGTDNQIIFEVDGGDNVIFKTSGEIEATSLDISGDADIDGTLEADAITVNGTALNTVIAGVTVTNATTAAVATTVTISDNESTNEENAVVFTAGGDVDGGNIGLESDGDLTYNPSTGTISATIFKGNIDAVDGDFDGTLEADAITLNGSAITTTATLSTGISNGNVFVATSGIADNDFLRVDGTSIEGRSASEVLSDIGATTASAAADEATALAIALG
jgi:cytoskeletal protein CcmA (bactofilin family)|tara:strand:+ start:78 stop:1985 length:1908 start_codon:yes stop_codon:yes gene_type:complete